MKLYLLKIFSLFDKFPSFVAIGGITSLVNILFFWISFRFTSSIPLSTFIGNGMSVIVNIFGLKQIFQSEKWNALLLVKYFFSMFIYYVVAVNLTILGVGLGITELVSRALVMVVLSPITYIVNKYLIF